MIDIDYIVLKTLMRSEGGLKIGEIKKILDNDCFLTHLEIFHDNGISHSTLGSCIKRLKKKGYVDYEPYHKAILTQYGFELAKELNRHSRLLEVLLFNELGLSSKKSHQESEKLSFLLSCEIINKICEKYGHPKKCPCGEPILNSQVCACSERDL
ncbi:MAG: iron dependent repressor, metal binding and dimerization domain protein [Promethearchaeota archaeon]